VNAATVVDAAGIHGFKNVRLWEHLIFNILPKSSQFIGGTLCIMTSKKSVIPFDKNLA
jgi:hypothetical protein